MLVTRWVLHFSCFAEACESRALLGAAVPAALVSACSRCCLLLKPVLPCLCSLNMATLLSAGLWSLLCRIKCLLLSATCISSYFCPSPKYISCRGVLRVASQRAARTGRSPRNWWHLGSGASFNEPLCEDVTNSSAKHKFHGRGCLLQVLYEVIPGWQMKLTSPCLACQVAVPKVPRR